jgi:hypothetical protein
MDTAATALNWWLHALPGGGLLLLLAWLGLGRIRQPARRQRLAEWALAAALLLPLLSLGPAWLILPVLPPEAAPPPPPPAAAIPAPAAGPAELPGLVIELPVPEAPPPALAVVPEPPAQPPRALFSGAVLAWLLLGAHATGALVLLLGWGVGHLALWRLLRSAEPAPEPVVRLCDELRGRRPRPRLLQSARVGVPFSFGLWRPTVVLPAELCGPDGEAVRRWVLAHELAHLERHDAWASLLFGLGQLVYFCFPWFWWLRRQVRLCQEYVADAAAVAAAGQPEDYAQFLLAWSAQVQAGSAGASPSRPRPDHLPAGVMGVLGHTSELYRRITMLLKSSEPVERRCPRSWSLLTAAGLLGLAVLTAGVGLPARAAPAPEPAPKEEPKKELPKKDEPKKDEDKKDPAAKRDLLERQLDELEKMFDNLPGLDREQLQRMRKEMLRNREQLKRAIELGRQGGVLVVPNIPFPGNFGAPNPGWMLPNQEGRLGVRVEKPGATLAEQLDLPRDQGLAVEEVRPDSAAARAGVKTHDILLELGGKAVPSNVNDFVKQVHDLKADKPVDVVVLRKGKKETLKGLSLPEAKAPAWQGFPPGVPANNPFAWGIAVPNAPFNPPAGFPGRIQVNGLVGNAVIISSTRTNDGFTATRQEGGNSITVTGKIKDGEPTPAEIQIHDGTETKKYDSLDKVPEQYRDKVKKLLQAGKGTGVQIQIGQ